MFYTHEKERKKEKKEERALLWLPELERCASHCMIPLLLHPLHNDVNQSIFKFDGRQKQFIDVISLVLVVGLCRRRSTSDVVPAGQDRSKQCCCSMLLAP